MKEYKCNYYKYNYFRGANNFFNLVEKKISNLMLIVKILIWSYLLMHIYVMLFRICHFSRLLSRFFK